VYGSWRQIGAESGRMASGDREKKLPNLQNLPKDSRYRRCVKAPRGRVLVKVDASQIELRIAAKITGDEALMEAFQSGADLHEQTARRVLGVREVTKEQRQLAKALNFGLLYGMGAAGLQAYARAEYGVNLTAAQARDYRDAFFRTYPGLQRWHHTEGLRSPGCGVETRTLTGRRRCNVINLTERLNSPVQGTGADVLKLALALMWERRHQCPGAIPVLAVHDEIVVEADADQADAAAAWVKGAMLDAMRMLLDPVPGEVKLTTARTWAGD
jgi:DNA polymerase-1